MNEKKVNEDFEYSTEDENNYPTHLDGTICYVEDLYYPEDDFWDKENNAVKVSSLIEDIRNKYYSRLDESDNYVILYSVSDMDDCEVFGTFNTYEEALKLANSLEVSSQIQKIVRDKDSELTIDIDLIDEILKGE